jgi:hypothetical protein
MERAGLDPGRQEPARLFLFDDRIVIPGPRVVEGTLEIARALHPDAFK